MRRKIYTWKTLQLRSGAYLVKVASGVGRVGRVSEGRVDGWGSDGWGIRFNYGWCRVGVGWCSVGFYYWGRVGERCSVGWSVCWSISWSISWSIRFNDGWGGNYWGSECYWSLD